MSNIFIFEVYNKTNKFIFEKVYVCYILVSEKFLVSEEEKKYKSQDFRPSVRSALRPLPSAQAENEKHALFPGKRAEISGCSFVTELEQIAIERSASKS